MALELSWAGEEALDRVADVRLLCFGSAMKEQDRFREVARSGLQQPPREFLLATVDGQDVGTVTSLGYTMWMRGAAVPCQGVAYVGTIKTHRRGGGGEKGIASRLMSETLRRARETGQWVSALLPFRASYYEHFGYGTIERRNEWTLPMAVLPQGDFAGFRFYRDSDLPALMDCRARVARQGQCDIERSEAVWRVVLHRAEDGMVVVDRTERDGPVHSWMTLFTETVDGKSRVRAGEMGYESVEALRRQLHFLSSLKDQHPVATLHLPVDLDLHWLLRESQVAASPTAHATACTRSYTRLQVKILDHRKVLEALRLPERAQGSAVVAVAEAEGTTATLRLDVDGGRASVTPTTDDATFACPDRVWAAIVCGELGARQAVGLGLATGDAGAVKLLESLSAGPKPFCGEAF
jgi:predicted acetyltransferase